MPCDMTVERPDTRIRSIDLHDDIPIWLQELHISPLRIVRIDDRGAIPISKPLVQDKHVVSVQMHRVRRASGIFDDETDGAVAAGVVHVPLGVIGVRCVARFGGEEERGVVICAEGAVVHGPEEVLAGFLRAVDQDADFDCDGCGGVGSRGDGVEGGGFG